MSKVTFSPVLRELFGGVQSICIWPIWLATVWTLASSPLTWYTSLISMPFIRTAYAGGNFPLWRVFCCCGHPVFWASFLSRDPITLGLFLVGLVLTTEHQSTTSINANGCSSFGQIPNRIRSMIATAFTCQPRTARYLFTSSTSLLIASWLMAMYALSPFSKGYIRRCEGPGKPAQ